MRRGALLVTAVVVTLAATACSDDGGGVRTAPSESSSSSASGSPSASAAPDPDEGGLFPVGGGRRLYLRCTGSGTPTLLLEGGDEDSSDAYAFAGDAFATVTRTCVYDRANLGVSDPDTRCRGLAEIRSDLEHLLAAAEVPGPYVLVGTSGGGFLMAGFAYEHPADVAGMVLVETPPANPDPPPELVEQIACDAVTNREHRDYLAIEREVWNRRHRVGDFPMAIISSTYDADFIAASPPAERPILRTNVQSQRGWLVLSPQARQVVVHTGHEVEAAEPQLVIETVLAVVRRAR